MQPQPEEPLRETYAHRQSMVVGILLVIVGCLCIGFGIVGIAIVVKLRLMVLLEMDFRGISGFGVACSVVVSISQTSKCPQV